MENQVDSKQNISDLWKVLRNECSFAEKAAIVKYPYKEGDRISLAANLIIHNAAYNILVTAQEIDTNRILNLATGYYEGDNLNQSRPDDIGRSGDSYFTYINGEWQNERILSDNKNQLKKQR